MPRENRRKCSRSFTSKSAKHRPENEFAVSSARYPTLAFNSGVARMRLGCETSVRRTQVVQGAGRRWDSIGSGYQPGSRSITEDGCRAGWREFGQAESECGKSDADIRLFTPINCRVTTPYAIVLKGHRCLPAKGPPSSGYDKCEREFRRRSQLVTYPRSDAPPRPRPMW